LGVVFSWFFYGFAFVSFVFYGLLFPGGFSGGATPVPIPNTEVKSSSADGTALVTGWESRSLPGTFF
jgi:hypothetical protein